MSGIWREIEIEWDGETYKVKPTLDFINHLERKDGRSLSKIYQRAVAGDLPSGVACEIIAETIGYAGGKVTAEEVFAGTTGGISIDAVRPCLDILAACMPAPRTVDSGDAKKKGQTLPKPKLVGRKSTA